jgi:hypothetical protein
MINFRFSLRKVAAIAACLTVIMFASCENDDEGDDNNGTLPATSGKFTLTGADAYNGQYAYAQGTISTGSIYGATGSVTEWKGIEIKNGKAELPMYYTTWSPVATTGYSGNDVITVQTVDGIKIYRFQVFIMHIADATSYVSQLIPPPVYIGWDEVRFTNGSVTKYVSERTYPNN